ncbi:M56 family metallopeptidase [Mesoflavibacter sp. SCSIO 43206]|uniref:M56 family metallopeptidase n=1 Tax=Mesoflavibacter sp. SCSIO 43206 TaxID=2779362 RepID=UPI001CA88EA5|nr:M56 family metallopeptidase [Mesoflavibacter sp. SCSIO 43206]UAB76115.1 M56 family metallopeptidase [Mesoflavibacter sp. SCSIO 43206]
MGILLLKSSACLAILMLFYKIVLEPLNHHHFKRFYLLAALLLSAIIPFITFIKYVEPTLDFGVYDPESMTTPPYFPAELPTITEEQPNTFLPTLLWTFYAIGVIVFSTRFILNLIKISSKIKRHQKVKTSIFINVLIEKLAIPHTFFNYIFLNKFAFENNDIPQEVLLHEQAHAKQKHSLDILFLEILQVIFWFNPLLYFIKKDIKLNHEFLADQHVLKSGFNLKDYQNLLLKFSSNKKELALVNAINYSSIKKRLTIMNTQTTQRTKWLRSLLLLPVLALLLFSFSQTKEVEKNIEPKNEYNETEKLYARSISIKVIKEGQYLIDGFLANKKNFVKTLNQLHQDISKSEREKVINIHVDSPEEISDKEVWFIFNNVQDYGYHRIVAYNQEIIRSKGNTPFKLKNDIGLEKNNKQTLEINQNPLSLKLNGKSTSLENLRSDFINLFGKKDVELQINSKGKSLDYSILEKVTKALEGLYKSIELSNGIKINEQTHKVSPNKDYSFNVIEKKKTTQDKQYPMLGMSVFKGDPIYANKKMIRASQVAVTTEKKVLNFKFKVPGKPTVKVDGTLLNEEAIKYLLDAENGTTIQYFDIKLEDGSKVLSMIVIIKNEPSKNNKKTIPLPPPPVAHNATKEQKEKYKKEREEYYKKYKIIDGKPTKIPTPSKSKNLKEVPKPPAPPKPKSPLDTVVEMSKKGATFYYNNEKITSDKAIKLLKENKNLNISSNTNNGVSIVHITD